MDVMAEQVVFPMKSVISIHKNVLKNLPFIHDITNLTSFLRGTYGRASGVPNTKSGISTYKNILKNLPFIHNITNLTSFLRGTYGRASGVPNIKENCGISTYKNILKNLPFDSYYYKSYKFSLWKLWQSKWCFQYQRKMWDFYTHTQS